jgi:isocitrate dehydrogenase
MTTFTKQTILTYQDTADSIPVSYSDALMIKADQMEAESKTDGLHTFIDEYRIKRVWSNQTAADEWVQFVATEAALYDVVITDYLIGDNI